MPRKPDHLAAIDEALSALRDRVSEAIAAAAMPKRSAVTLGEMIHQRRKALRMSLDQVVAEVVDQCNKEGPYNAIGAAARIRKLVIAEVQPVATIDRDFT